MIKSLLTSSGLDWKEFLHDIGLPGEIRSRDVADVDLHHNFETALARYAEAGQGPLIPSPPMLATAILEMVAAEPDVGLLGERLIKFGLDIGELREAFAGQQRESADQHTSGPEGAIEEDESVEHEKQEDETATTDDPLICPLSLLSMLFCVERRTAWDPRARQGSLRASASGMRRASLRSIG